MKTGIILCNQCNKKFSVYVHRKEKQGEYITAVDNCSHHEFKKNGKKNEKRT